MEKTPTSATILVVEDHAGVRAHVTTVLRGVGYKVIDVSNGPEAIAILGTDQKVDLLFSDIVMPRGISGVHLARQARKRRPDLKVLLTSGYSEETLAKPSYSHDEFPLLAKPYRVGDLTVRVRALLSDAV